MKKTVNQEIGITVYEAYSTGRIDTSVWHKIHAKFDESHTTSAWYKTDDMFIDQVIDAFAKTSAVYKALHNVLYN